MPCGGHPESGHGPGRGMPWPMAYERNQPNRAAAAGGRQSSVTCMHALVVDTPIRFLPWALAQPQGRRARPLPGAGRATARVRATGKRTSRDGDVCTDAGSERPAGDAGGSLIAPFVPPPGPRQIDRVAPHPTPRSRRRLVPVALLASSRRIIADYYSATTTTRHSSSGGGRGREPNQVVHSCMPFARLPRAPLLRSHFTRSRSRVVARPACAKCYRYLYRLASRQLSPGRPARAVVHARGQAPRPISSSPSSV